MPQLDFREALSTPEEKIFSPVPAAAVPAAAATVAPRFDFLARGLRLTRSTWANIIFVTIASVGGLFSAFYFFNGAEVLRAAASWPSEFLYPRPAATDVINATVQPNPVDTFSGTNVATAEESSAKSPLDKNGWPTDPTQPLVTSPLTAPGIFDGSGFVSVPSGPGPSIFSTIGATIEGLGVLPPGGDSLFQSLYQTAVSTVTSTTTPAKKTVRTTVRSTRRKASLVATRTGSTITTTTQNVQQTTATQTQISATNTIQTANQTMVGGGLSGVGGTVGGTVGGVTGTGGLGNLGGGLGGLGGLGGHH